MLVVFGDRQGKVLVFEQVLLDRLQELNGQFAAYRCMVGKARGWFVNSYSDLFGGN